MAAERARQRIEEESDEDEVEDPGRQDSETQIAGRKRKRISSSGSFDDSAWFRNMNKRIKRDKQSLQRELEKAEAKRTTRLTNLASRLTLTRTRLSLSPTSPRHLTQLTASFTTRIEHCTALLAQYEQFKLDLASAATLAPAAILTPAKLDVLAAEALCVLEVGKRMAMESALEAIAPGTRTAHPVGHITPRAMGRDEAQVKSVPYVVNGHLGRRPPAPLTPVTPAPWPPGVGKTSAAKADETHPPSAGEEAEDPTHTARALLDPAAVAAAARDAERWRRLWLRHVMEVQDREAQEGRDGKNESRVRVMEVRDVAPLKDVLCDLSRGVEVAVRRLP